MNKTQFLDNIEEYLNKELSPADSSAFEALMRQDGTLRQAFERRQETINALKDHFAFEAKKAEFKAMFEELKAADPSRKEVSPTAKVRTLFPSALLKVAAMLAFAMLLGLGVYWFTASPNNQQLATNYYELTKDKTLMEVSGLMGASDQQNTQIILSRAEQLFNQKKEKQAIDALAKIPKEDPLYYQAVLLQTLCHFSLGDLLNTRIQLNVLKKHPSKMYDEQVAWFSALAFLYENNTTAAQNSLEKIIKNEDGYAKEAKELLEHL